MPRGASAAVVLVVLASGLAGCASPGPSGGGVLARPRIGDVAEYVLAGHLVEFARWANGVPLVGAENRLVLRVAAQEGLALDGFRARHAVFRVDEELSTGGALAPLRSWLVSPEQAAVVQGAAPLAGEDAVVSFDERGYPWAWGASAFHGETLAVGRGADVVLLANAGQAAPLAIRLEVVGMDRVRERDAFRVTAVPGPGFAAPAAWTLWLAPDVPYPLRVEATLPRGTWEPFVRLDTSVEAVTMRAELASITRGDVPLPPRNSGARWLDEPVEAEFVAWDREKPPDGGTAYAPFVLAEAVEWAETFDSGFRAWREAHPRSLLYRATHFAKPGPIGGVRTFVWLVQHVSEDDAYYEVQVERSIADAVPGLPGLTRATLSRPATAPEGDHGWFPPDDLPDRLLTIGSGVEIMRDVFQPSGVEIFVRSFTDPVGYAYYVDGGFEEPAGRFTVIVNAQSGFLQAAVGPVRPVVDAT